MFPLLKLARCCRRWQLAPTAIAVAALSGCAVGPDFHAPAAPAVDRYTPQPAPATTAAGSGHGGAAQALLIDRQLPAHWWRLFGSPRLDALVQQAFAGSPTVTSAQATLRQARETLRAEYGALVPSFDAKLGGQRQKTFINFGQPSVVGPLDLYNAGVEVSYGIDLFGGLRRSVEAQGAVVDYQRYELQATYQTLAGNVVTTAVQVASLRQQLAATQAMIDAQREQAELSEKQYRLGAIARTDLLSARSELATLQATLPPLQQSLAAARTQLAVYLGRLPSERIDGDFALDELTLPADVPLGVPSELVRRRPDVLAAEAQLHQASAEVGVATANLFPKLTLTGSIGSSSDAWSTLFDNKIWSIGADITQPLLHGGTLRAQRRAALAAFDAARADYRQTVLNAFKNVADALQAVVTDAAALKAEQAALAAAEDSLQLTQQQYRLGGVSYVALLTAQRQAQQARINYLQRLASRYQDTAALMLALGGGWTQAPEPEVAARAADGARRIDDSSSKTDVPEENVPKK